MKSTIEEKCLNLGDLTIEEAVYLHEEVELGQLTELAGKVRYIHNPLHRVSWQIDRNVNYTNVCISGCKFCNFHCKINDRERSYTITMEELRRKIDELLSLGGNQLLLQGGLHPKYDIVWYENLFRALKEYEPSLKLNALGPPEVAHIARVSSISIEECLKRLVAAGLDTLPGAGAEILSDRVRKIVSPAKPSAGKWLEVMSAAHKIGLSTTATMVYGHIETIEERMNHLILLRDLQARRPAGTVGFRAFILWPMQCRGTLLEGIMEQMGISPNTSSDEFLRMIAVSRLVLNNIGHIQASWLTTGIATGCRALHCGADDMGSIMIEENVVSSTGLNNTLNASGMQEVIRSEGFEPWLRDQQYNPI